MKPFVFSCDAHIVEPLDLFTAGMPEHLKQWAPNACMDDNGMRLNRLGETVLFKIPGNFHTHRVGEADDLDTRRLGARDLKKRLVDMNRDGVDAELCFPSLGLLVCRITDAEAVRTASRVYNDWAWDYLDGLRNKLVPTALIPTVNMEDALAELEYVIQKGYRAVTLPISNVDSMPKYNDPAWDPFVARCAQAGIPLCFHTGVGQVTLRALKGPGGALYNYTRQMNDAVDVIAQMVGGGVLDRHPSAHILFAECGAGWLYGLAERMDEVYYGHAPAISPKLSRKPSDIVRAQVHCAVQNDTGAFSTIQGLTTENFLFATDYPHSEGTFPRSMQVVEQARAANPGLTEEQWAAVLGGNASRLFGITREAVERETAAAVAA
ncbi:amidohydrolase family protein [Paraburkholderia dinghuensis]|uniref:Amidohydrolase n=1 Tax=Paraburkholderia dinghuensis TaxID=2305225 RepID=A0A3N6N9K8_9BURK|nr:amidohydrolase family protein [Paraburkholderia dinghuensis]RQH04887.1 amidohydrolase [Paraburkholderia dinghuensis]